MTSYLCSLVVFFGSSDDLHTGILLTYTESPKLNNMLPEAPHTHTPTTKGAETENQL